MNARDEFLELINFQAVKCAEIRYKYSYLDSKNFYLKVDYSREEFEKFVEDLNFEYDSGYGDQELYGTIWFENGTYADRSEYDGSEWWEHHILPDIPEYLLNLK